VEAAIRARLEGAGATGLTPIPHGFSFAYRRGFVWNRLGDVDAGAVRLDRRGPDVVVAYRLSLRRAMLEAVAAPAVVGMLVGTLSAPLGVALLAGGAGLLLARARFVAGQIFPEVFALAVESSARRLDSPAAPPVAPASSHGGGE
jgi:hypothetical protein